jgi:nucleoside-triphosphatase THEP1
MPGRQPGGIGKETPLPDSRFAHYWPIPLQHTPRLILLTGPSGAGKTSWCQALVSRAGAAGRTVAGLLSPPVWANGRKQAIDLLALHTGERRRLALRCRPGHGGPGTPTWQFEPETIAWGSQILNQLPGCDYLFLDELGPLEFHHNQGLQAGFALIDEQTAPFSFVTIRPTLVAAARRRWPWAELLPLAHSQPEIVHDPGP